MLNINGTPIRQFCTLQFLLLLFLLGPLIMVDATKSNIKTETMKTNSSDFKQIESDKEKILILADALGTHYDFALNIVNILAKNDNYEVHFVVVQYDAKRVLVVPESKRVTFLVVPFNTDREYERHFDYESAMDHFIGSQTEWNKRRRSDSAKVAADFIALLKYNMFSFYKAILEHRVSGNDNKPMLDWLAEQHYNLGIAEFCLSTGPLAVFHRIGLRRYIATSPAPPSPTTLHMLGQRTVADVPERFTAQRGDGNNASGIRNKNSRRRKQNASEYQLSIVAYERMYNEEYKALYNLAAKRPLDADVNIDEMPPMGQLLRRARFFLVNVHPLARFHVSMSKRIKFIGGIEVETVAARMVAEDERRKNDEERKDDDKKRTFNTMPTDYEWIGQESCVIVFSMGTMFGFNGFTRDYAVHLFNEIVSHPECKFLVRIDQTNADILENLLRQNAGKIKRNNIEIVLNTSRIPQKEILTQPNVRGFIHHCGQNTLNEVLYAGVPFICIPFFGDQFYNAALAEYMDVGIWVEHEKFVEQFADALDQLLMSNDAKEREKGMGQEKKIRRNNSKQRKRRKVIGAQSQEMSWDQMSLHARAKQIASLIKQGGQKVPKLLSIVEKALREKVPHNNDDEDVDKRQESVVFPPVAIQKNGDTTVRVDENQTIAPSFGSIISQFMANNAALILAVKQKEAMANDWTNGKKFHAEKALRRGLLEAAKQEQKLCSTDIEGETWDESGGFNDSPARIPAHTAADGDWKTKAFSITVDGVHYTFKDYAAQLFCHLRQQLFHIEHTKYFNSLTSAPLIQFPTTSKSKTSLFMITSDGQFMLKSLSIVKVQRDLNNLKNQLAKYAEYLSRQRNRSFLPRFHGLYCIEIADTDKNICFLVMPNILTPTNSMNSTAAEIIKKEKDDNRVVDFDMKGCYFGRKLNENQWNEICSGKKLTLKDWEFNCPQNRESLFPNGIILQESIYEKVAKIINDDAMFLGEQLSVLDYSLFISIHFNEGKEAQNERAEETILDPFDQLQYDGGGLPARCIGCKLPKELVEETYDLTDKGDNGAERQLSIRFGIIDILSIWYERHQQKMVQRCTEGGCLKKDQSSIKPKEYAARFKCFINRDVFHVDNDRKMQEFEQIYCAEFNNIDWDMDISQ